MLFDLRGRGRRRTVQVIYLSLAILMGGGLVLFGIGGEVQGGLFDAFQEDTQRDTGTEEVQQRLQQAEAAVRRDPRDAQAWAALTRARYQAAVAGDGFDQSTGSFTEPGRRRLGAAADAWQRYLALDPPRPDDRLASLMANAYGPGGLDQPAQAVRAMEILIDARPPTSNLYTRLAVLAYEAEQTRKGDLAAQRAVELADRDERRELRRALRQAKQAAQGPAQDQQQSAP